MRREAGKGYSLSFGLMERSYSNQKEECDFMLNVDEYIQTYVKKSYQLHAYQIAEELWDFLKALDEKGFLRARLRGTSDEEKREVYVLIERNAGGILAAFNKFYDMYLNEEKRKRFFELTKEFGFSDKVTDPW